LSPASDGYWSAQVWARERVPEHQLNATLRNATQRQQRKRLQANAMPLWVIRLSVGLLIAATALEETAPPSSVASCVLRRRILLRWSCYQCTVRRRSEEEAKQMAVTMDKAAREGRE